MTNFTYKATYNNCLIIKNEETEYQETEIIDSAILVFQNIFLFNFYRFHVLPSYGSVRPNQMPSLRSPKALCFSSQLSRFTIFISNVPYANK